MKRETFNLQMAVLVNAFSYAVDRITDETLEIYWLDLKDVPDERFVDGCAWCRYHRKFFPSIAELGAASHNGHEDWHERIVERKRLAFYTKTKSLESPMSEEERRENQRRVHELAESFPARKVS